MEENMILVRDPKTFCFNFHWRRDVESLQENKFNEIEQL